MKYLSPISLFTGILIPPLDRKAIQLGRKKLLAELELAGGNSIEINGKSYDKNEIISYFEELLTENTLEYHTAVSIDKTLIKFLQESKLDPGARFIFQDIYLDNAFIRWISPYFSQSFRELLHDSFQTSNDLGMAALLNNPLLMTAVEQEKIWTDLSRVIQDEIDLLERYFTSNQRQVAKWRDNKSMKAATIASIMEYEHARILCLLPESRFAGLRDKYAFAMMQASIVTFNRHQRLRGQSANWCANAGTVASSPQLKRQIADKLEELHHLRKKWPAGRFRMIIIIIIAINIGRFIFPNSNNGSGEYRNNTTHFQLDSSLQKLADSLHHLNHPGTRPDSSAQPAPSTPPH
jgi:hypothetical protein